MALEIKDNFYKNGRKAKDIEMPPLGEMPPVLADNPSDWAGNNQQIEEVVAEPDEVEAIQETEDESQDDAVSQSVQETDDTIVQEDKQRSKSASENMRILREAREKAERERDELMRYVLEMKKSEQKPQPQKVEEPEIEPDIDLSVDDDALLEGKHAKKLIAKIKSMEKKLDSYQSRSTENTIEAKIKSEYPDFDVVVNQANIAQLNAEFPEIATTLRDTKDLYSKATAAYKIMKKFGIYKDKTYDTEKAVALKNSTKPRTVTSLNPQQGDSPLSKANAFANGMTKDLQNQLLKEMAQARKNL